MVRLSATARRPSAQVHLFAPGGMPLIEPGAPLAEIIHSCLTQEDMPLQAGDIVVLAQKIVSKAEDRYVALASVAPSARALDHAARCAKDPRLIELVLRESTQVMRCKPGVIIVRHRLGFVLANAGIDHSNVQDDAAGERVLLLPFDPDGSAARLRSELQRISGVPLAVAIIDSFGRAWRIGTAGTCIGASGLNAVQDLRGQMDLFGRTMVSSIIGVGDEVAAAASMLMGQSTEGRPVAVVRGMAHLTGTAQSAAELVRPLTEDLFP